MKRPRVRAPSRIISVICRLVTTITDLTSGSA